jgi:hypothetical protein
MIADGGFPALSLRQPWAELIVSGRKPIEVRAWERDYRGRIWIHAAKHVDEVLDARFDIRNPYRGGFIGSAELTSIEPFDAESWEAWRKYHLDAGPFRPGLFAWVLASPRRLASPVRARGNVGLYDLDPELHAGLLAADAAAEGAQ